MTKNGGSHPDFIGLDSDEDIPTGVTHLPPGPAQVWGAGLHRDVVSLKKAHDPENPKGIPARLTAIEALLGNINFSVRLGFGIAGVVLGAYWLWQHLSLK